MGWLVGWLVGLGKERGVRWGDFERDSDVVVMDGMDGCVVGMICRI